MNTNYTSDFCYLLIDTINNGVLYNTSSSGAAKAMLLFSSNIQCIPLETHHLWARADFKESNFNDFNKHYTIATPGGQRTVQELPESAVDNRFKDLRKEVKIRTEYHALLINIAMAQLALATEHNGIINFGDTIIYEIQNCRPDENYYTDAVRGYALGSGIDNQSAYDELKLHVDNLSHQRMRNMGIYVKFRNMLNQVPAETNAQKSVIGMAVDNLVKNSFV
jgi:hypothetical protein